MTNRARVAIPNGDSEVLKALAGADENRANMALSDFNKTLAEYANLKTR